MHEETMMANGTMASGIVCLQKIRNVARQDPAGAALEGTSLAGRSYGKLVTELVATIPVDQGFYVWGRFDQKLLWWTIYLGKASIGKTASLRARIAEELKDERAFAWCNNPLKPGDVVKKWFGVFGDSKGSQNHVARSIRKEGATHIIWVATPDIDAAHVGTIESDLIETLNPIANVQRPSPSSGLQDMTVQVIRNFKKQMHECRESEQPCCKKLTGV